jgi:hypothetical protein
MAAGGAAPLRGGEVTGVAAGACYGGSGVAGVGYRWRRRLDELDAGVVATRTGSERGKRRGKSSGRARVTLVRNSGRQERQSTAIGLGLVPVEVGGIMGQYRGTRRGRAG